MTTLKQETSPFGGCAERLAPLLFCAIAIGVETPCVKCVGEDM